MSYWTKRNKCQKSSSKRICLSLALGVGIITAQEVSSNILQLNKVVYASAVLGDETADLKKGMVNSDFEVKNGEKVTTWSHVTRERPSGINVKYNGSIILRSGGIWRPMDARAIIVNGPMELYRDSLVDLAYKYSEENYPANNWNNNTSYRGFVGNQTILHDGAILSANVGGNLENEGGSASGRSDSFTFDNPQLASGEDSAEIKVKVKYRKNFGGIDWEDNSTVYQTGSYENFIALTNIDQNINKNLNFVVDATYVDDSLHKYFFNPELVAVNYIDSDNNALSKWYNINWTISRTELISQGVYSAANAQLAMRNMWRIEEGFMWHRGEELRTANLNNKHIDSEAPDGAWAQVWRGKYDFGGAYGSNFTQNYNGIQVGYDKAREGKILGGKLYTGAFISMLNADADFNQHSIMSGSNEALYSGFGGDLKSNGIGVYSSWIGDNGQYFDFIVRGSKVGNKYKFTDSDDRIFSNDYDTWSYGAGFRYGYSKELSGGWYIEPQVGLTYGTMKEYSFTQATNMRYTQDKLEMLTGRLGVKAGRKFKSKDTTGMFYAKAAVNHDFKDSGSARADVMQYDSYYQKDVVKKSMAVDTLAGKDTWYEVAVGTNFDVSKDKSAFVELSKTFGGEVNTDWQINAGFSWSFGGPSHKAKSNNNEIKVMTSSANNNAGQTGKIDNVNLPQMQQGKDIFVQSQGSRSETATDNNYAGNSGYAQNVSGTKDGFVLAPLVVEAARPDWEKKLSPGTVSVIHVPEYKGEMKNLPDLLQTVPGVYVQRLSGTGHYSVARVRGATGGQVNIYIDGVMINSASDSAVDLSTIPVENVERVEVYRGYVPARFAGSPLGGAINIVTKKPQDTKGSISIGARSFDGYTGNLELTAPVGSGSLLVAVNRDQAKGDFDYTKRHPYGEISNDITETRTRMNNDYHNTDALIKWQDDNWFAKLTYKNNKTRLPESAYGDWVDVPFDKITHKAPNWDKYRQRTLEIDKTELLFGRRQTTGNLEWGWKLNTSYQKKAANSGQFKHNSPAMLFTTVDNEFRNRSYGGAVDGSWKMGKNHLVEFLLDYSRETMNVNSNGFEVWPQREGFTSIIDSYKQFFKTDYKIQNYFFQAQDTMTLNKSGNLFFTPVLRAQKMTMDVDLGDPELGEWKYSYGLGLKKVQNEHWTFRGTYGTYYKFPNFYELFGDGVNVLSRWEMYRSSYSDYLLTSYVEHGRSWDVGANWQGKTLGAGTDISLTYFNRSVKNMSTYSLNPYGYGFYSNLAAGKIQGAELEGKMSWDRWDLMQSVTWNDSLITKSGMFNMVTKSESQAGNPFPWIPEWETNTRLSYRFPGDKLTVFGEYHYLGKIGVYSGEVSSLYDSLGITNIGLKYNINSKVKLTAGVNDLFDKAPNQIWHRVGSDIESTMGNVSYPQQGRTYYMTVQYFF